MWIRRFSGCDYSFISPLFTGHDATHGGSRYGDRHGCSFYLQPDLLVHGDRPVAEGDGVAEAGLPLNDPLGQVHDDLRALRAGVEKQGGGGQTPTGLHGQAAFGFVVASVGRGGAIQSICEGKQKKYITE